MVKEIKFKLEYKEGKEIKRRIVTGKAYTDEEWEQKEKQQMEEDLKKLRRG